MGFHNRVRENKEKLMAPFSPSLDNDNDCVYTNKSPPFHERVVHSSSSSSSSFPFFPSFIPARLI